MSIRRTIISLLEQYESFFRFKYSKPIYTLVKWLNPSLEKTQAAEYQSFRQILAEMPKKALVFDIGASVGNTTAIFQRLGAQVLAVEPDPVNLNCLRARYAKNPKIEILPKALSNESTTTNLYIQEQGNTLHTLSDKWKTYLESPANNRWQKPIHFSNKVAIVTTTLDELIAQFGSPFYIKIDVEGHEEKVIQGLNQAVPLLSFEANLPEFLPETLRAIDHLSTLSPKVTFNYATTEKLMLESYVSPEALKTILKKSDLRYLDVFCKSFFY